MHQIKEMLEKMGFEIVADETQTTEWREDSGFFVVKNKDTHYRIDYTIDSYGSGYSIGSVKEVKPKEVTKVEYI